MISISRARRGLAIVGAAAVFGASISGVAFADTLQDSIEDNGTPVTLVAGSPSTGSASIRVVANNAAQDPDDQCNFDTSAEKLTLEILTPTGVTAAPNPLVITACGTHHPVTFTAAADAESGTATVKVLSNTTGGTFVDQVSIPISVTNPNTKPTVAVTGVTHGAEYVVGQVPPAMCDVTDAEQPNVADFSAVLSGTLVNGLGSQTATCDYTDNGGLKADTATATYTIVPPPNSTPSVTVTDVENGAEYEINQVPVAGCAVTDAEDGPSTTDALITGTLFHGLGQQTATCDHTDSGGLAADTASVTYSIVDTGAPTITGSASGTKNAAGWYKDDVTVTFTCADEGGSGIDTCYADGETSSSKTLGEGANQSVTGTATDWAGNTATAAVSGLNVDKTPPTVALVGGPTGDYYYGYGPAAPTCEASDLLSGLASSCVVSGGGSAVGSHTWIATATDKAGNVATARIEYTVKAWTVNGFYAPVDMGGTVNTVKAGSTVPLKFEVFAGTTEIDDVAKVAFATTKINCSTSAAVDEIEMTSSGSTVLRYDTTGGQFIQNWKTPAGANTCYKVTMTAHDGTSISALFKLR